MESNTRRWPQQCWLASCHSGRRNISAQMCPTGSLSGQQGQDRGGGWQHMARHAEGNAGCTRRGRATFAEAALPQEHCACHCWLQPRLWGAAELQARKEADEMLCSSAKLLLQSNAQHPCPWVLGAETHLPKVLAHRGELGVPVGMHVCGRAESESWFAIQM